MKKIRFPLKFEYLNSKVRFFINKPKVQISLEINPLIDEKETQKAIMKGQKIVDYSICKFFMV